MLESDDVDEDYFTPISSTSLANIFGSKSNKSISVENESLKYVPPKPQNVVSGGDEAKPIHTQCLFACTLLAYEWLNNIYTSKGKVGFAVIKVNEVDNCNIVLYDSNKSTLSSTTVSPNLEVNVKEELYLSYFDDLHKYWSLYATKEEVESIINILKVHKVNIKYSLKTDIGPPILKENEDTFNEKDKDKISQEDSDTDTSVNQKTKASILSRMASMGHSILPLHTVSTETVSDSSDTNDGSTIHNVHRHKLGKTFVKRHVQDNLLTKVPTTQHNQEIDHTVAPKSDQLIDNLSSIDKQVNFISHTEADMIPQAYNINMNLFMSELRISNTELRINMNRMNDKVDQILDKCRAESNTPNMHTDILLKLLAEYENKIKIYEEKLKYTEIIEKNDEHISQIQIQNQELELRKQKIIELEEKNKEKQAEINKLQNELCILKDESRDELKEETLKKETLQREIEDLKHNFELKKESKYDCRLSIGDDDTVNNKIKKIMNDTFQTISMNFVNNENYSGEFVKGVIAKIIKKVTLDSLNK